MSNIFLPNIPTFSDALSSLLINFIFHHGSLFLTVFPFSHPVEFNLSYLVWMILPGDDAVRSPLCATV